MRRIFTAAIGGLTLFFSGMVGATTITFDTTPTNTTYLSSGLLLSSSSGGYEIGGCGGISAGCLGTNDGFNGTLTFTFVNPNTTTQSQTDMVSFVT